MNYSNNSSNSIASGSANGNASGMSNCNGTKYVIKKGDTLYSISRRYNVPLALILRANPYVDVYNLQVGDVVCIPSQQESATPSRPPVVTGPGPVVVPGYSEIVSDDMEDAEPPVPVVTEPEPVNPSASSQAGFGNAAQSPVYTAPVTIPARNDGEQSASQTAPSYNPSSTSSTSTSQNNRTEMGSRNTFNFNYYGGSDSSRARDNEENVSRQAPTMTPTRGRGSVRQTIPVRRPAQGSSNSTKNQSQMTRTATQPAQQARTRQVAPAQQTTTARQTAPAQQPAPARTSTQTRQTVPVRRPQTITQRMMPSMEMQMPQNQPVQEPKTQRMIVSTPQTPSMTSQPKMAARARMVAPVRIIAQPIEEMNDDKESCNRWNAYQDRERFNSIMYDNENIMKGACKKTCPSKCTENVLKPSDSVEPANTCKPCEPVCQKPEQSWDEVADEVAMITYVSRDNDTLQDILDYFTMDLNDLFIYTVPNEIKLKPGCMIQVRGKGDDR